MNEDILKEIMLEVHRIECGVPDDLPDFKSSLRHRMAMKRIFARFERNARKLRNIGTIQEPPITEHKARRYNLKQRILIATLIIILMTLLAGCVSVIVKFVSERFNGTVYEDNTQLFAVNSEKFPQTIEYLYALTDIPEGFELIENDATSVDVYTLYENNSTKQTITLRQWVKSVFKSHFNTQQYLFEEVTVNGKTGLCLDLSNKDHYHTLLIWDNEDYIIGVVADLDKKDVLNLLNITKL